MTLRHLRIFDAVCRNKSITKAAQELFIAQPAVSNTISEIEKHYSVVLFNRINRRLVITEQGNYLWQKARAALLSFDEFEQCARDAESKPFFSLGATLTVGKLHVPHIAASLEDRIEGLDLRLKIKPAGALVDEILSGTLDVAIVEGNIHDQHIISIPVSQDRLIAFQSATNCFDCRMTLAELSRLPLLMRESGSACGEFIKNIFAANQCQLSVKMESASNEAIITAVLAGLGVVILPEGLVSEYIADGRLREISILDVDLTRKYNIIYRKNRHFSPGQTAMLNICTDYFIN